MIVETDFLDHWKTQMLIGMLDDSASPCYLLRLWAHCQTRKEYRFQKMSPAILKAITRAPCEAQTLWDATSLKWVSSTYTKMGQCEAHGFHDANSQLIANWNNGKKGGRPRNKASTEKPIQNPTETHPEPIEERERGEEIEKVEKQDEGEKELSPSPCKVGFWIGKPYGNVSRKAVCSYDELHVMDDPIEAAMAVTGDFSLGMYGMLVKGCKKSLQAGLSSEGIKTWLFEEVEKILGEIKTGERERGKPAASAFTARMQEYFATVDKSSVKAA